MTSDAVYLPQKERPVGRFLFRYRSLTAIPWAVAAALFARPLTAWSWVGVGLVVLGEGVRLWALGYIGRESRVTTQGPGASRLVTHGPYGWVRNPLYVGNVAIIAGLAMWSGAWWPWFLVAGLLYFIWQYILIIGAEEAQLLKQYGAEFRAYRAVIPAWIPRFTRHPLGAGGRWRLKPAITGELRSLNTVALVIIAARAVAWWRYGTL